MHIRHILFSSVVLIFLAAFGSANAGVLSPEDKTELRAMAGQMLLTGFRGLEAGPDSPVIRDIVRHNIGGVILFDYDVPLKKYDRNIASPEQVRDLVASLRAHAETPLFIAVDQEGGRVARLKEKYGFPPTRSAADLGAEGDPNITRSAGTDVGATLADMGFNLDFAPVVDVNTNPDSPAIGKIGRSFSADPKTVAVQAGAFIQGLHSQGILSCVKHFPGHGSAAGDSHLGVTDVTRTWTEAELIPYKRLFADPATRPDMVMTAHIYNAHLDADFPATLSRRIITGILRNQLGWEGIVVSDDLQMKAVHGRYGLRTVVASALNAGVDILLFGNNLAYEPDIAGRVIEIIVSLVEDGTVPRSRIEASHARIRALKRKLAP